MANTQRSWNGPIPENQSSLVRGRKPTDNRQAIVTIADKPKIEMFTVAAGLASTEILVSIVADGKTYSFTGNRRRLMQMLSQVSEAVFKMEPGK